MPRAASRRWKMPLEMNSGTARGGCHAARNRLPERADEPADASSASIRRRMPVPEYGQTRIRAVTPPNYICFIFRAKKFSVKKERLLSNIVCHKMLFKVNCPTNNAAGSYLFSKTSKTCKPRVCAICRITRIHTAAASTAVSTPPSMG